MSKLLGAYDGVPGMVIGSGPTLIPNLPYIRKWKKRTGGIIYCGLSNLNILMNAGIKPDFMNIYDIRDTHKDPSFGLTDSPEGYYDGIPMVTAPEFDHDFIKYWMEVRKNPIYFHLRLTGGSDNNIYLYYLKYLAGLYTGYGDYAKEVEKNLKLGTLILLDKQVLQRYCAYDAAATYRIYTVLLEQIKREGLTTLLEEQMQLLGTVIDMEHHGFKIDMKELTHLRGKVSSRIRRLSSDVLKQHPELKNLDSPKQISSYLYEALHLPVKSKTQKGSPSGDEGALEGLLETTNGRKHEDLLRGLLERRKLKKILSTYIDGTREACDGQDLVHPSFNLCGTVTGRFSCSSPNLQNIPRDDTASGVKRIFTARPGNVLVQADYSQIELRIGAFLSRDKTMLRALRAGDDLHRRTGEALYSDITGKETVITDEQRTVAKTVNFGIFYGMGPRRLHQTTGIPLRQASQFIKRWYTLYPGVRDWLTGVEEELLSKGYVTSIFGRRRRLPIHVTNNVDEYKHMLRQACNFPVQSAASELTQMAMILLGKEYQIVGNVHDSILIECPEGVKEEVIPRVKQVMEHVTEIVQQFGFDVQFDLPMPVDIKSGSDWGDVS